MAASHRHRKAVLEEGLVLSLPDLRQRGFFDPGQTPRWITAQMYRSNRPAGEIELGYETLGTTAEPWLSLRYRVSGEDVYDRFDLVPRPQPFGGYSWLVRCPETGSLAKVLYMPPGAHRFRSRKAYAGQVAYHSQCLNPGWRALSRRDKIAERIVRQGPPEWQAKQLADFPGKPPWMRWPTWCKALEQFVRWDEASSRAQ